MQPHTNMHGMWCVQRWPVDQAHADPCYLLSSYPQTMMQDDGYRTHGAVLDSSHRAIAVWQEQSVHRQLGR